MRVHVNIKHFASVYVGALHIALKFIPIISNFINTAIEKFNSDSFERFLIIYSYVIIVV